MSALGHKRTFAVQNVMSAVTPIADKGGGGLIVRFVSIADCRLLVRSPDRRLFRIIKPVDEPATLKFVDDEDVRMSNKLTFRQNTPQ